MSNAGYESFAVYWVPPLSDPLARFGLAWTGWCADTGLRHRRIAAPVAGVDFAPITRDIGRQGFHALLRAPFRMKDRRRCGALERDLSDAAESCPELKLPPLRLGVAGGRVALLPDREDKAVAHLLRRIAEAIEPFAAAPEGLDPGEDAGGEGDEAPTVPVRPATGLHMPLTDRMPERTASRLAQRLTPALAPLLGRRPTVSEIALVAEADAGGRVRIVQRMRLGEAGAAAQGPFACSGPRLLSPLTGEGVPILLMTRP